MSVYLGTLALAAKVGQHNSQTPSHPSATDTTNKTTTTAQLTFRLMAATAAAIAVKL